MNWIWWLGFRDVIRFEDWISERRVSRSTSGRCGIWQGVYPFQKHPFRQKHQAHSYGPGYTCYLSYGQLFYTIKPVLRPLRLSQNTLLLCIYNEWNIPGVSYSWSAGCLCPEGWPCVSRGWQEVLACEIMIVMKENNAIYNLLLLVLPFEIWEVK